MRDQLISAIESAYLRLEPTAKALVLGQGKKFPEIKLSYDLRGAAAGQCRISNHGVIELRFNLDLAAQDSERFLRTTVAHELAHAITWKCYPKAKPHGTEWKQHMRHFGIDKPERCHNLKVTNVHTQKLWLYECACQLHKLSTTRHNRARKGIRQYICKACGEPLTPAENVNN